MGIWCVYANLHNLCPMNFNNWWVSSKQVNGADIPTHYMYKYGKSKARLASHYQHKHMRHIDRLSQMILSYGGLSVTNVTMSNNITSHFLLADVLE